MGCEGLLSDEEGEAGFAFSVCAVCHVLSYVSICVNVYRVCCPVCTFSLYVLVHTNGNFVYRTVNLYSSSTYTCKAYRALYRRNNLHAKLSTGNARPATEH